MIVNPTRLAQVIAEFEKSPYQFYITGSRFFGYFSENSDHDFFVDEGVVPGHKPVSAWLKENGFNKTPTPTYNELPLSAGIVQVWCHTREHVHVQIVKNAQLKADVQDAMFRMPRLRAAMPGLSKKEQKLIWEVSFEAFMAGQEKEKLAFANRTHEVA